VRIRGQAPGGASDVHQEADASGESSDDVRSNRRPSPPTLRDAGLLSPLQSRVVDEESKPKFGLDAIRRRNPRVSNEESNFNRGLKELIRQSGKGDPAHLVRTPVNQIPNPEPAGRLKRWYERIERAAADRCVDRPPVELKVRRPESIPIPDQVERPSKSKLAHFKSKIADLAHPIRVNLRSADVDELNQQLALKRRNEAVKEIGKRLRYAKQQPPLDTAPLAPKISKIEGLGESKEIARKNVRYRIPGSRPVVRLSTVAEEIRDESATPAPAGIARSTIEKRPARPNRLKAEEIAIRHLRYLIVADDPSARKVIMDAAMCDDPGVAKTAMAVRGKLLQTWRELEKLDHRIQQSDRDSAERSDAEHKVREAIADLARHLEESHRVLSAAIAQSRAATERAVKFGDFVTELNERLVRMLAMAGVGEAGHQPPR